MNTETTQDRYLPIARLEDVDGRLIQMVNWQDYKGWQCRDVQTGLTIGLVHGHEFEDFTIGLVTTWVATTNSGHAEDNWYTLGGALKYLIINSGVARS